VCLCKASLLIHSRQATTGELARGDLNRAAALFGANSLRSICHWGQVPCLVRSARFICEFDSRVVTFLNAALLNASIVLAKSLFENLLRLSSGCLPGFPAFESWF